MLRLAKLIFTYVATDLTIENAIPYLKKIWEEASRYLNGDSDDSSALAFQTAQSLTEQSISVKLLSLPGGWNIIVTLYRNGSITTSMFMRAALLRALSTGVDVGFVAKEKLDEVFATDEENTLTSSQSDLRQAQTLVYFELEARGLI